MSLNLNKIVLDKAGDQKKINLTKDSFGKLQKAEIVINLNWTKEKKASASTGFFNSLKKMISNSSGIDLDLGCFYELRDGKKMVIDGIQFAHGRGGSRDQLTNQGRYSGSPWIWHTGDDRVGAGGGEIILINSEGISHIKRIVIYCFIYGGVARWSETNAFATVKVPGHPEIVVEMGNQTSNKAMCALAEILFDGDDGIIVKKQMTFHNGHAECDQAYSWGLRWTAGSK
jgi:tellurite resistance protein TerA